MSNSNNETFFRVGKKLVSYQINKLEEKKEMMVKYMHLKIDEEDWHGVADAAMDIREMISALEVLKNIN